MDIGASDTDTGRCAFGMRDMDFLLGGGLLPLSICGADFRRGGTATSGAGTSAARWTLGMRDAAFLRGATTSISESIVPNGGGLDPNNDRDCDCDGSVLKLVSGSVTCFSRLYLLSGAGGGEKLVRFFCRDEGGGEDGYLEWERSAGDSGP